MNETVVTEESITMDKLINDFKVVIHDAEALIKGTAGDLGEKAKEARQRLSVSLETARANFYKVEDKARDSARATDRCIRDHPYESMGAAFGIGLLIGVLVGR